MIEQPKYNKEPDYSLTLTEAVGEFSGMEEANVQPYEYFKPDPERSEQEKQAFLDGDTNNPRPGIAEVSEDSLRGSSRALEKLLGQTETDIDDDPLRVDAFYEIIAERAASYYFIRQANRVSDMDPNSPSYNNEVKRLQELNDSLYGVPNQDDFDALLSQRAEIAKDALKLAKSSDEEVVIREYLSLIDVDSEKSVSFNSPDDDVVEHYHGQILQIFSKLLSDINLDPEKEYSPELMQEVFSRALESIGADEWTSQVEVGGTNLNVDQANKIVNVGERRKTLTGKKLAGLVLHEVGIHVQRRVSGEKTDNPLLWNLGLAGYYTNEEGLGKFVEQALAGKAEIAGIGHYLNAGLSLGLDGTPRDFREVFEVDWRGIIVDKIAKGESVDESMVNQAKKTAYNRVMRVRRGMPADVKGVAFTKDLAYFNGTANIWRFMEMNADQPEVLARTLIGKHDPMRPDHVKLVEEAVAGGLDGQRR